MNIKNLQQQIENLNEFKIYYDELVSYNNKVNLTAITEKNEVYLKHFLDSVLPIDEIKNGASVVDVGTGAGLPGLPIRILRPDVDLTLVDSLNKRVNFLNLIVEKLQLKNVKTAHARAEDFCKLNREKFDVAIARAVAKLSTLLEYLLPLVKVGGIVLAYKGNNFNEELEEGKKAIEILGGKFEKTLQYNLPNNLGERNIIVIKKIKPTPSTYPRTQNKPKTDPIK